MTLNDEERDELIKKIAKTLSREVAREQVNREWGGTPEQVLQAFRDAYNDNQRRR